MIHDDALLNEIREKMRTQVRPLSFAPSETHVSAGVDMTVPLNDHAKTVIGLNVHELDAWAAQMRGEAARLRRLRWYAIEYQGGTRLALLDRLASSDDDPEADIVEVRPERYATMTVARERARELNHARREEMSR